MPCGSEVLSRKENYTSHTCMKCIRVILFPVVSDTASGVTDIMENYTSHTCLKCIRVILFSIVSDTA